MIGEIAANYAVDGIHLDYVRFPNEDFDYSPAAMQQFKASILPGLSDREKRDAAARAVLDPVAYPNLFPERWSDFRRARLTSLVLKIRTAVKTARPNAVVSAAVVPDAQEAFDHRLQDWRGWIDQSLLDVVCPMAYTADADIFQKQIAAARDYAGSRPVWAGIGAYQLSPSQTLTHIAAANKLGVAGVILFSYDALIAPPNGAGSISELGRAAFGTAPESRASAVSLSGVDYLVIGVYLLAITAFGSWFARFQKTTRDYFLTDRSVPWWAICFTIVATETSTLTFIGIPAQAYTGNMTFLQLAVGYIIGRVIVSMLFIPAYFRGDSVHVVRAAAAPLRHARQDPVGGDLPDHPIARRRHPPVHDGAGDLDRHAGAGDRGGDRARRGDDRLHHARRRVGGDLDRRRPDVRLHRRRRRRWRWRCSAASTAAGRRWCASGPRPAASW